MTSRTASSIRLNGPKLHLARLVWILTVGVAGSAFTWGAVNRYHEFQQPCDLPVVKCADRELLTPENIQALEALGVSAGFYAALKISGALLSALVWCGVGLLIFFFRSDDRLALLVGLFLFLMGTQGGYWQAAARLYPALSLPAQALSTLTWLCFALFFSLFPNGRAEPGWMRWVVVFVAIMLVLPARLAGRLPESVIGMLFAVLFAVGLYAQVYRYRKVSTPTERLQTKWVLFGVTLSLGFVLAALLFLLFIPSLNSPGAPGYLLIQSLANLLLLALPFSIGFSILRFRLWDVDLIIRRTLIYGALTLGLGLVYLGSVTVAQNLLVAATGQRSTLAIVVSSLAIAALFTPFRRRIHDTIDRRFYRRKYDSQKTLESFATRVRDEVDLNVLSHHLVGAVREAMQPETVTLWLKPTPTLQRTAPPHLVRKET